jgi:DNA replication protein DnaC
LHLIGPPKAGRSVYFGTLADVIGTLAKAEREGALREKIRFFCRFALLIVDEIATSRLFQAVAISSSNSSMPATKRGP